MIPTTEALLAEVLPATEAVCELMPHGGDAITMRRLMALIERVRDATVAALVDGEGLDFEAAFICHADCPDGSEAEVFSNAALDRQYRARVGALRAQLAELTERFSAYKAVVDGRTP